MIKGFEIDKNLYHDLEAAQYDYERTKDVLITISSMGMYDNSNPELSKWESRLKDTFRKYQLEKQKFERGTIRTLFSNFIGDRMLVSWNLDYYTSTLTLEG